MNGEALRQGFRQFLLEDDNISDLVGGKRVHALKGTKGEKVAKVIYQRISSLGDHFYGGPSGLVQVRMQVASWAPTSGEAGRLADIVHRRLDGFKGHWPYGLGSPQDHLVIEGVFFNNEREGEDTTAGLCHVTRDYMIHYKEF